MRNHARLNAFFNRDRKTLYIILSIVMISVLTLTVVYAALSTTLNINGNAEVTAASWDIYLDNIQLNSNSTTTNVPTITDKTTASFSTTLSKPGDFYEFTIDVMNNGTIDAMIESITKKPELSDSQKKYLNYIVEYQNGESINTKQLVSKNSFVRLKVKVEFRKDIAALDLPQTSETLNLSFKVNYVQSDDSDENVSIDNNGKLIKIVSGDYDTVGSEICIGEECFYVISSTNDSVTMLAKYNLYVGSFYDGEKIISYGEEATGKQDSTMLGFNSNHSSRNGITFFSELDYWNSTVNEYPLYVYNKNSIIYEYVENYKKYIELLGVKLDEARLIKQNELISLGCGKVAWSCSEAPSWVYSTSYWSGSAAAAKSIWYVYSDGRYDAGEYYFNSIFGVRPVIKILKTYF